MSSGGTAPVIRAPRGKTLMCRNRQIEAAYRMIQNNLDPFFPPPVLYISLFNLLIGNAIGIYLNMLAGFRRGYYDLIPWALLNPIYWVLHSIAAYKALWQLFTRPFYWEKTTHGLSRWLGNAQENPGAG